MMKVTLAQLALSVSVVLGCQVAFGQHDAGTDAGSGEQEMAPMGSGSYEHPPLVEGMTLDEALDAAAAGPPESWPEPIGDNPVLAFTLIEQLEFRVSNDDPDQFAWDAQGWIGNDDHKFWWKSEGTAVFDGPDDGDTELQALYARPISPFWYLQAGLRYENAWAPSDSKDRASLVLGLQGLAPYKFELEPVLFLTEDGDLLARFTASYDLYLTQRLALQPRSEINFSASDITDYGVGEGINDLSLELRLRYEIRREFAPYVGLNYVTLVGETADIGRRAGSSVDSFQVVFGIRIAF